MRAILAVAVFAILALTTAANADPLAEGKEVAKTFLQGDPESLWPRMTPEMQQALGAAEALTTTRDALNQSFGSEDAVETERVTREGQMDVYRRTSRWTNAPTPMLFMVALDQENRIAGLLVRPQPPAAESTRLNYKTKAKLRLPFDGEWTVVWGGRTVEDNYHAVDAAQRFALDLLMERQGQTHMGDPQALENYHCWDQPILSPGNAVVANAVDGLPDQRIDASDPSEPAGNHVVLDFGNGEFGFLAHMREGSVKVATGDRIAAGQEVGRCGNSGNTSEPHLHFHMQTKPALGAGEGLPVQFESYVANGEPVAAGEPKRGEVIRSR